MATISKWNPDGVALDITATSGTIKRTSATQFTVVINASWKCYYSGGSTNYGMKVTSGGKTIYIPKFDGDSYKSSGSGTLTGTYSISGNGAQTKSISVVFDNYKDSPVRSFKKTITLNVNVPAWTSYTVSYNANGGSGAPGNQTKWKDQTLTLSSTKPTRTGYEFKGWALSKANADAGTWYYQPGGSCGKNENLTLYAVWEANTYQVKYDANGGTGAPSAQTKTYGKTLTLSSVKPTRTNYNFKGWATSASATTATYDAGGSYTANAGATLYAVWELAYSKPRITNLSVVRCDSNNIITDEGEYVLVTFDWACDQEVDTVTLECRFANGELYGSFTMGGEYGIAGKSGSFSNVYGYDQEFASFDANNTYVFTIVVRDSIDSYSKSVTLNGLVFPIDFSAELVDGKPVFGVAIGKPAEMENVLDVAFQTHLRGGLRYGVLENNADLNNQLIPGFYVGSHLFTYVNCPVFTGSSFTLEVLSGGDIGQLIQRLTTCDMNRHVVHERAYYESYWGEWMKTSPTVIYEEMFYTPSAAETFERVGSITIPKRTAYTITARGMWQNSRCHGVIISDRQTTDNGNHPYSYSLAACFNEDDRVFFPSCTYSGDTGVEARTFYIWAKWQATNLNKVEVTGYYMPY